MPKKLGVELVDPIDETSPIGDRLASDARLRVVKPLDIPAIGWHFANGLAAFDQQFPECFRVIDSPGNRHPTPIMATASFSINNSKLRHAGLNLVTPRRKLYIFASAMDFACISKTAEATSFV